MKYKGYFGKVEYDDEGKIFTGEVIGLRSVITFQGRSIDELEKSFQQSIDLYLDMCRKDGIEPEKPYSGRFNVRITPDLHRDIAVQASIREQSLNEYIASVLSNSLKQ